VNPTTDGVLSWRSITSCTSDSNTRLENWQQRLHEFSTRRCARIDRAVRWVGTDIRETPSFHGVNDLEEFLTRYKDEVLENYRLLALDIALKKTPTRWWVRTKKQSSTGTNVSNYCASDLVQNREATNYRDMMDKGHQPNTWISVERYG
jgi:hypothetical protein